MPGASGAPGALDADAPAAAAAELKDFLEKGMARSHELVRISMVQDTTVEADVGVRKRSRDAAEAKRATVAGDLAFLRTRSARDGDQKEAKQRLVAEKEEELEAITHAAKLAGSSHDTLVGAKARTEKAVLDASAYRAEAWAAALARREIALAPARVCALCKATGPAAACEAGHAVCGGCWPAKPAARDWEVELCKEPCPLPGCKADVPWSELRWSPCVATAEGAHGRAVETETLLRAAAKRADETRSRAAAACQAVTCEVCSQLMVTARKPVMLRCGDTFCADCIVPDLVCCGVPAENSRPFAICHAVEAAANALAV